MTIKTTWILLILENACNLFLMNFSNKIKEKNKHIIMLKNSHYHNSNDMII